MKIYKVYVYQKEERWSSKVRRNEISRVENGDQSPEEIGTFSSLREARKALAEYKRRNNLGKEIRKTDRGVFEPPLTSTNSFPVFYVSWLEILEFDRDESGELSYEDTVYASNYFIS